MEQHELKSLIVDAFVDLLAEFPQTGWQPGIALQPYAPDTPGIVERVIGAARERIANSAFAWSRARTGIPRSRSRSNATGRYLCSSNKARPTLSTRR
jgi:hypothetical protein